MIRRRNGFLQLAKQSCRETQTAVRNSLLRLNVDSRFSIERKLVPDLTIAEFRSQIGIGDYETVRPYIEEMQSGNHRALLGQDNELLMYALTSGTTSQPKLIPVTRAYLKAYRRGWQHWGISMYADHAPLKNLKMVQLTSSHDQRRTSDGIPCGNISGLVTSMQNRIVQKMYVVPPEAAQLNDASAKQHVALIFALSDPLVGMFVTANPGTLLHLGRQATAWQESLTRDIHNGTLTAKNISSDLLQQLQKRIRPNPARAQIVERMFEQHGSLNAAVCWPNLQALGVWTGGSAGAYRSELKAIFGGTPVRDHGLHASEGRITIPFENETAAGVLDIESHYFEFLPLTELDSVQPEVLEAHELTEGQDYFLLMTTASGLWRYNIRDVIRCTGYFGTTPLLEFRHKGKHISSITGEKITESQVVDAMQAACNGSLPNHFTVTPCWGKPPGYRLIVEGSPARHFVDLANKFDFELRQRNCEYDEKRTTGRLTNILCEQKSPEVWETFRQNRLQVTGGSSEQYKHPCLLPDPKFDGLFDLFCS